MKNPQGELPFDKFMDQIIIKEQQKNVTREELEDTPQRIYNKLYRETPHNRMRIGGRSNDNSPRR